MGQSEIKRHGPKHGLHSPKRGPHREHEMRASWRTGDAGLTGLNKGFTENRRCMPHMSNKWPHSTDADDQKLHLIRTRCGPNKSFI